MKTGLVLYNAYSGTGNFTNHIDYLIKRFQEKGISLIFYRFELKVKSLKEILKKEKYEFIIISGGDGTLNIAINYILKTIPKLPIGVIPSGTSNDFARSLDIPNDIKKAIDIIVDGNTRKTDIGLINKKRYFLSTYAGGMLAGISYETPKDLKEKFGPFAYYMYAFSQMINLNTTKIKIEVENEIIEEEALMLFIVNGKHAGGFENLISIADTTDGLMDIVIIKNLNHIRLPVLFINILKNDFINNSNIRVLKTEKCRIEYEKNDVTVSVDGEKGNCDISEIEFLKQYLEVYVK